MTRGKDHKDKCQLLGKEDMVRKVSEEKIESERIKVYSVKLGQAIERQIQADRASCQLIMKVPGGCLSLHDTYDQVTTHTNTPRLLRTHPGSTYHH